MEKEEEQMDGHTCSMKYFVKSQFRRHCLSLHPRKSSKTAEEVLANLELKAPINLYKSIYSHHFATKNQMEDEKG